MRPEHYRQYLGQECDNVNIALSLYCFLIAYRLCFDPFLVFRGDDTAKRFFKFFHFRILLWAFAVQMNFPIKTTQFLRLAVVVRSRIKKQKLQNLTNQRFWSF